MMQRHGHGNLKKARLNAFDGRHNALDKRYYRLVGNKRTVNLNALAKVFVVRTGIKPNRIPMLLQRCRQQVTYRTLPVRPPDVDEAQLPLRVIQFFQQQSNVGQVLLHGRIARTLVHG